MISARIFYESIPKYGNGEYENEDAVHLWRRPKNWSKLCGLRCAIADGATQASFSRLWARILVKNAVKDRHTPSPQRINNLLNESYQEWQEEVEKIELPWYAIEKTKKGAFTTFLWASIRMSKNKEYANLQSVSVGDSELFVVRDGKVLGAFPLSSSEDFNSFPKLISSKSEKNLDLRIAKWRQKLIPGDDVVIATDALAKYILGQYEQGGNPLETIKPLIYGDCDQKSFFSDWIGSLRLDNKLKNDDSTIAWIHLFECDDF